jgi:hypothetical protein
MWDIKPAVRQGVIQQEAGYRLTIPALRSRNNLNPTCYPPAPGEATPVALSGQLSGQTSGLSCPQSSELPPGLLRGLAGGLAPGLPRG